MQLKVELWPEAALFTTKVTATVSRLEDGVEPAFAAYVRKICCQVLGDSYLFTIITQSHRASHLCQSDVVVPSTCHLMSADTIIYPITNTVLHTFHIKYQKKMNVDIKPIKDA